MKKKQIAEKLTASFNNSIPNKFDDILLKCQKGKGKIVMKEVKKDSVKNINEKTKLNSFIPKLCLGGLLVFVALCCTYFGYSESYKVDSIIGLDVNPSVELEVNKKEQVVKVLAKNDDAKEVLKDMDLDKADIDVALNAIIGSMVTKGYIDDLSNSILVSVENDDKVEGEKLRQKLVTKINGILGNDHMNGSVLSQSITNVDSKAKALSEKYDISLGKANLILDILSSNKFLTEKDLVGLSINELNVLCESKNNKLQTLKKEGTASTKAYIGKAKAKQIALDHAGVSNPKNVEIDFDADDGLIVYEVDFASSKYEYEYEINAKTGKIVKFDKEKLDSDDVYDNDDYDNDYDNDDDDDDRDNYSNTNSSSSTNQSKTSFISKTRAKQIALNHAKISNPRDLEIELDREDNKYSVEFIYNDKEYEYEINAKTGAIINFDSEILDKD